MKTITKLVPMIMVCLITVACGSGGSSGTSKQSTIDTGKPNKMNTSTPKSTKQAETRPKDVETKKESIKKEVTPSIMDSVKKDLHTDDLSPITQPLNNKRIEENNIHQSNEDILKGLEVKDINSGIITISDVVLNLKLDDNKNVKISLLNEDPNRNNLLIANRISNSEIKTLNDSTGKLLGYYGYMQLNQVKQGEREGIDSRNLNDHYLLSMNDNEKRRPANSLVYKGNMFYQYTEGSNEKLEASVSAKYNHADKKLSMDISGKGDDYWQLGNTGSTKLLTSKVNGASVDQDGTILNAKLYSKVEGDLSKLTPDANFSGGLFGKNGEVLAGSAISPKWHGVIGAKATETNHK
ncbi:transferrin-binding protein-like solute binding protein [Actinobacillus arthritidis]|uniref:transferrin-binding protein-like solute binding protein n=1 Tax=Actinobacillus arthritidis TaxID=157339 RepID=UPI0024426FEA|nr:transferrin-binding protein-like solute binding protein [Actinobacillus arthritidis]WGE89082.1 transferrin-binding protein-like solute binding protein [Actinobacillus arthritidis]